MRHSRGQVAVETAIVLPLFVFIILGLIQLGLMHQARLMTKYAAYKAVRAGSLNRGDNEVMRTAALSVLMPMITGEGPRGLTKNITDAQSYRAAYDDVVTGRDGRDGEVEIAKVTVCNPTTRDNATAVDFDDPAAIGAMNNNPDWATFMKTRLAVQVQFNYRLIIPFADMMIWHIVYGQESLELMKVMRIGNDPKPLNAYLQNERAIVQAADQRHYFLPIRAGYSMRMFSNFKPGQLPTTNQCMIPWARPTR